MGDLFPALGETKEGQSVLLVQAVSHVTLIQIISMPKRHIWGRSVLLSFRFIIYYWIPGAEIAFWTWTLLFSLCFHTTGCPVQNWLYHLQIDPRYSWSCSSCFSRQHLSCRPVSLTIGLQFLQKACYIMLKKKI